MSCLKACRLTVRLRRSVPFLITVLQIVDLEVGPYLFNLQLFFCWNLHWQPTLLGTQGVALRSIHWRWSSWCPSCPPGSRFLPRSVCASCLTRWVMMIITIIVIFITVITWVDLVDCGVREAMVLDGSPSYSRPTFATLEIFMSTKFTILGQICLKLGSLPKIMTKAHIWSCSLKIVHICL